MASLKMAIFERFVLLMSLGIMSVAASTCWTGTQNALSRSIGRPMGWLSVRNGIRQQIVSCRGGSTALMEDDDDEEEEEEKIDPEEEKKRLALRKWRMDQQMLMQLRSVVLSEVLAKRGIPIPTLMDVSTKEGDKPPESIDWDCAMSTEEEPKTCLYSFDAEPNTKVVGPIGTTEDWITLSSLNRLRRTDPTKVEPMWHSKYSILQSWFGEDSEFSLLQHVGFKGFLVSVLLDSGKGMVLRSLLVLGILSVVLIFMPVIEFVTNRFLVSGAFWGRWPTWSRIVHAALPLKLLIGQVVYKSLARSFAKLEAKVRDFIVDIECDILEECTPLTVGPGSEVPVEESPENFDEGWDEEITISADLEESAEEEYDSDDW